ncbi:MAG: NAD(P)H-dependent glycerol-3-phosphate dehydrogenase [Pseudomonadota bacterium]
MTEKNSGLKIAICGAGAWGTALGHILADAGHDVTLIGRSQDAIDLYNRNKRHKAFDENVILSEKLKWTLSVQDALPQANIVFLSLPTQYIGEFLQHNAQYISNKSYIVQTAKGIEIATGRLLYNVMQDTLKDHVISFLSGPSFAIDVVMGKPTAVTIAADRLEDAAFIQRLFAQTSLRPYTSDDIIGVALGGALKNILAIAAGFVIGYGLGESAKASIITRGFAEILKFSQIFGGKKETLYGLSGLGDIILTCGGEGSRNFRYGAECGAHVTQNGKILKDPTYTAEGYHSLKAIMPYLEKNKNEFPIFETLSKLLTEQKDFPTLLQELLTRPLKQEV